MTKKYYLIVEDIQKGPFTLEELKSFELDKSRLVWFEELEDWTPIENIGELSHLIKKLPPPIKSFQSSSTPLNTLKNEFDNQSFIKKNKWYFIGGLILSFLFIVIIFTENTDKNFSEEQSSSLQTDDNNDYSSSSGDSFASSQQEIVEERKELSPDELKEQLLKKEQINPLNFLIVNGSISENKVKTRHGTMFRSSKWKKDGYNFEGYISNSATLATFKDIVVRISYISSTGTIIDNIDFVVYDFVQANDAIPIKQKVYAPEGTSNYEVSIVSAKYNL